MSSASYLVWLSILCPQMLFGQVNGQEPPPPPTDTNIWQTVIMFALAILFFYFILFRPEQKRKKAMEMQRNSLKEGDRVSVLGILGTVMRVDEATVVLRLYDGAKMEVMKGAITDIVPGGKEQELAK